MKRGKRGMMAGWTRGRGLLLAALFLVGCGRKVEETAPGARPAIPVAVAQAQHRNLTRFTRYVGSVEPVRVARMASPAEGPVVECAVREGDRVGFDQQLVRLGRNRAVESAFVSARDEVKRQQVDVERIEKLVESGALPGEQRELARIALRRAEAQVAAAETVASDYEIRAPWDGIVANVWISEGNYVSPRTPLVEIYDPASLRVRFSVPERDARWVYPSRVVTITLDAWPDQTFPGVVERIYPQLDAATRTLTVEANLETDVPLIGGLFARITVPLETVTEAVTVPSGAVLALPEGGLAVYVAMEGVAARRLVDTGVEAEGYIQISNGVAVGEAVVIRGQERLRDGASVRILGGPSPAGAEADAGEGAVP